MATSMARESDRVSAAAISPAMTTTALDLPGFRLVKTLGVARGVTVRTRTVCADIAGACAGCAGGRVTIFTTLAEASRAEAYQLLLERAREMGANAVVALRYDATMTGPGYNEVICYGTAVIAETVTPV